MFIKHKPYYKMSMLEIIEYGEKCDIKLKSLEYMKQYKNSINRKTKKRKKVSNRYTKKLKINKLKNKNKKR